MFYFKLSCLLLSLLSVNVSQASLVLSTIIGGGDQKMAVSATQLQLNHPQSIVINPLGELYIADSRHQRVLKIDQQGQVHPIAGTGVAGYNGDELPAELAQLNYPTGLALDGYGQLYIADSNNDRIRMIDTAGLIHTIVGQGQRGYAGDQGDALQALLSGPSSLAFNSRAELFISDRNNNVIRHVDAQGIIHSVAGGGEFNVSQIGDGAAATQAQLWFPGEIVFDPDDNLYIADMGNNRIRIVLAKNGLIYSMAGSGRHGIFQSRSDGDGRLAIEAEISLPYGLAFNPLQNTLYFSSMDDDLIRQIDAQGIIQTLAGSHPSFSGDAGLAINATLHGVAGLAVNQFNQIYIADAGNHRIRLLAENQLPVAMIHADRQNGILPFTTRLNGLDSFDPEAGALRYHWFSEVWGDLGASPELQLNIDTVGIYGIQLTVTDLAGDSHQQQILLNVHENHDPVAAFNWQTSANNPLQIQVNAHDSYDPDGDQLQFRWLAEDALAHLDSVHTSLSWSTAGRYRIALEVSDAYGALDTLVQYIDLEEADADNVASLSNNHPPQANFDLLLNETAAGLQVQVDASRSHDLDDNIVSYTWLSSDYQQQQGKTADFLFTAQHVHHLSLTVTDSTGLTSQTTRAIFSGQVCVGTGVYSPANQILQLPQLRRVKATGESEENQPPLLRVTLQQQENGLFNLLQVENITVNQTTASSPCTALYHPDGWLELPQVDVVNTDSAARRDGRSAAIQRFAVDLRYLPEQAGLKVDAARPVK